MLLKEYKLLSGGTASITSENMVFVFERPRTVLSTSEYLGGINKLSGVVNQKLPEGIVYCHDLPGGSVVNYFALRAKQLGNERMSILLTSAKMQCYGHCLARNGEITVEAFATGGVQGNATRAGEPALYEETGAGFSPLEGTINLFVFLSFALPPGLMAKALITLTEAKSALLQELGVYSVYDEYTATGTSTDGVVIVINDEGFCYSDVGSHSQIGNMFANCAKQAIFQALRKECYITEKTQLSAKYLLEKLSKDHQAREIYFAKFNELSLDDKEQIIEALSIWHMLKEKHAFGGLPNQSFALLKQELFTKYSLIEDFLFIF